MHICHFISSKGLGRGEFYIDLVNEMIKTKEINISLLVPKEAKYLHRVSKEINIIEYESKDSRNNPFLYLELSKIFKKNSFDIVHTHFAKSTEIFNRLNKLLKKVHIATKHNPRKGRIFNKMRYSTAVSDDVAKSIKSDNVKIIYNGLTPIKINNTQTNETFTIRAIGRLDKIKGFDKLIEEFSKVSNKCKLEIIGDGEEYNNLQQLISKYNLENRVKLLGFKTNIPELISSADLIIMSSLSEGFSLVMIESIFYGKLFVSTPVSGSKDILPKTLLIEDFNFSKKIDDIIINYKFYTDEFKKVKNICQKKFLLENISNEYIDYYNEVLKVENSSC